MNIYGARPTVPWQRGHSWHYRKAKGDKRVENKLEGLVGLVICFNSNLSSSHVILFLNGLLNPNLWDIIYVIDGDYHLSSDLYSYVQQILINFSEALIP